jgi:hypothetical protein
MSCEQVAAFDELGEVVAHGWHFEVVDNARQAVLPRCQAHVRHPVARPLDARASLARIEFRRAAQIVTAQVSLAPTSTRGRDSQEVARG